MSQGNYVRGIYNGDELTCIHPRPWDDTKIGGIPNRSVALRGFKQGMDAKGDRIDEIPLELVMHAHDAKRLARMLLEATEPEDSGKRWMFTDEGVLQRVSSGVRGLNVDM